MKTNRKIAFAIIATIFITLTSVATKASGSSCKTYTTASGTILAVVVSVVVYQIWWNPHKEPLSAPDVSLSTALENLYNNNAMINASRYDEVPTLASHNSFAYPDDNVEWAPLLQSILMQNQILNTTKQLEFGVRTFLIDIYPDKHDPNAPISFSHESIFGYPLSYKKNWIVFLGEIEAFLSKNSNEIITLHLESDVESYSRIAQDIYKTGLSDYLYNITSSSTDWDKREDMIDGKGRLLIFSDANGDCGKGIMNTRDYILENHYEGEECRYRDFQRLKIPKHCITGTIGVYQCTKNDMHMSPVGSNKNQGAIIFLMNHFQVVPKLHYIKRALPFLSDLEIRDYYRFLNSYGKIRNRIQKCYCEFMIPKEALLSISGVAYNHPSYKSQSTETLELGVFPNTIALDFLGEEESDEGARGIVRDMLFGNFTVPTCP